MNIEFKTSFNRDIKKIIDSKLLGAIEEVIKNVEIANSTTDIKNWKKLIGYKTYSRIKIGDYRIGLNIENDMVSFVRFLHRKEIYKYFP